MGLLACGSVIRIEPISTSTPIPTVATQPTASTKSLSAGGVPMRIVAEAISLDVPVVEMGWKLEGSGSEAISVWNVPDNEAGWHLNSATPGQGSNVVISGHNNSLGGHVFGELEALAVGDQITIQTAAGTDYRYQISETQIVRAFGASPETLNYLQSIMEPSPTEQLTVITCWPSWSNTHRFVIIAHPL